MLFPTTFPNFEHFYENLLNSLHKKEALEPNFAPAWICIAVHQLEGLEYTSINETYFSHFHLLSWHFRRRDRHLDILILGIFLRPIQDNQIRPPQVQLISANEMKIKGKLQKKPELRILAQRIKRDSHNKYFAN